MVSTLALMLSQMGIIGGFEQRRDRMWLRFNKIPLAAWWGRDCRKVRGWQWRTQWGGFYGHPGRWWQWSGQGGSSREDDKWVNQADKMSWLEQRPHCSLGSEGWQWPQPTLQTWTRCPSRHLLMKPGPSPGHKMFILPSLLRGRYCHDSI